MSADKDISKIATKKKPSIQSGVVPYFYENGRLKIILVKTKQGKKWTIPKGVVEKNMTPWDSAAKEAKEEAGIKGKVSNKVIFKYKYKKLDYTCKVKVYLMLVQKIKKKWDEDFRERAVFDIEEASEKIGLKTLQKKIKELCD